MRSPWATPTTPARSLARCSACCLVVWTTGCAGSGPTGQAPPATPVTRESGKQPAAEVNASSEQAPLLVRRRPHEATKPFEAWAQLPSGLEVGRQHEGIVTVHPLPPWHINRDVVAKIRWRSDAHVRVHELESSALPVQPGSGGDLHFPVHLEAQVNGVHWLQGELDAGFCRETSCIPVRAPVRVQVAFSAAPAMLERSTSEGQR